ncbi:DUF6879 family protein [Streptomyces sp. 3211]|uniref:DUF6879 family protein n=1 Tax=Streptomyces sp. 3211 TaxID=1964449 RepID=UPI0009A55787|nr:DUF6879 family protein [Streptomyces sp. 3211]
MDWIVPHQEEWTFEARLQFGVGGHPVNEEAGEHMRWFPRHSLPVDLVLPGGGNDWWEFDDKVLAVGPLDENGRGSRSRGPMPSRP